MNENINENKTKEITILEELLHKKELQLVKREEAIAIREKEFEQKKELEYQNIVKVVFVCHTMDIVYSILKDPLKQDCAIFFVGKNEINTELMHNKRIIVARDLPDNIEDHNYLLTFTAWYAIIKNNLFSEYKYICILEYDVSLEFYFFDSLFHACIKKKWNIISFLFYDWAFNSDINEKVFKYFLNKKNINYQYLNEWYPTTNQCLTYSILKEFVNWFFPDCLLINKLDPMKISWYHERMFNYFVYEKKYSITKLNGLNHDFAHSHDNLHKNKNSLSDDLLEMYFQNDTCEFLNKLINNYKWIIKYNKTEEKSNYYYNYDAEKYYKQLLLFKSAKKASNFLLVENGISDALLIVLLSNPEINITFINYHENNDNNNYQLIDVLKKYFDKYLKIKVKINYIISNSYDNCEFLKKEKNFDLVQINKQSPLLNDVLKHFNIFQQKIVVLLE